MTDLKEAQARFIEIIANGGTWRQAERELVVSSATIAKWLQGNEALQKQYAHAKEACADRLFDEILEIADDARNDWMSYQDDGGGQGWKENGEAIRRSQIRIDARKWMAGKLRPKVYGEKVQIGGDQQNPLTVQVVTGVPRGED